jgi:hypothetical protein
LKVTPLSAWGKPYTPVTPPVNNPGFSMTDKPQTVILAMGTEGYFNLMAKLMAEAAPPAAEDAPMIERMAKIGIVPGKPFELSKLDPAVQAALKDIPQTALKSIEANKNIMGGMVDGWVITKGLGTYGPGEYMKRAVVAAFGWPANQERDAVYPYTEIDSTGQKLTGAYKYTLTFAKDATPPVNGFWSITMYKIDQGWWFTPNALNKYTVSPRNNPKYNARWLVDALLPERIAGRGQGGQLASGSQRRVPTNAADVLAEGYVALDPKRKLESAAGGQGELSLFCRL